MQTQQTNIIPHLKALFSVAYHYYLKIQPHTHLRVTHGDRWILASTDEYLKNYDERKGARSFNRKQQIVRSNEYAKELAWICKRDKFDLASGCFMMVFMKHMPDSWRKGKRKLCKRDLMAWKPMEARPDIDNFYKKLADSLVKEDKALWCAGLIKIWIPDEVDEGIYFINIPVLFQTVIEYLKEELS